MRRKWIALGLVVLLAGAYFGTKLYLANMARKNIDAALAQYSPVADVAYRDVDVNLFTRATTISGMTISPKDHSDTVTVAEIVIRDIDNKSEFPAFLSLGVRGLDMSLKDFGDSSDTLKRLGYPDRLVYDLDLEYRYDTVKKDLDVGKLAVTAKDAGSVDIAFHLGNIALDRGQAISLLFTYPSLIVHSARITYADRSLVERVMKTEAADQHQDLPAYKAALVRNLDSLLGGSDDAFAKGAAASLKQFINDPQRLSISIAPAKPVRLGDVLRLQDPKEALRLLNVQLSAS